MLNTKNLPGNFFNRYRALLERWKDNKDALLFLQLLDTTNDCIFLTGKAGTGKSTLIKDVVDFCKAIDKPPLVLGSTGISALNIGGQTVHSFFCLGIENVHFKDIQYYLNDKSNRYKYKLKKDKIHTLLEAPFVIIDEISMLHSNTMDCINFLMKYYLAKAKGNHEGLDIHKPFGGRQVVFVGDVFQLPPVNNEERTKKFSPYYDSEWFFDSKTFKKLDYSIVELKKSYRQEDDLSFGKILDSIRNEAMSDEEMALLNKQIGDADSDTILLSTHRSKVDDVNNRKMIQLPGKEHSFEGITDGYFPNSMKKADDILTLKQGAKIMMVSNDREGRWVNGSMGIVKDFTDEGIDVQIGTEIFCVSTEVHENKEILISGKGQILETVLGTYKQFPLKLAYAVTIHKSQGMTFDACNLDLGDTFTGGQVYTALSRSRTLAGIKLLSKIERRHLYFHPSIKRFIKDHMQGKIVHDITNSSDEVILPNIETPKTDKKQKIEGEKLTPKDEELFQLLRKYRLSIATEEGMPPYIIFSDSVLKDIVRYKPQSKEEMLKIKGIRQRKFDKYGKQFLEKIQSLGYKKPTTKQVIVLENHRSDELADIPTGKLLVTGLAKYINTKFNFSERGEKLTGKKINDWLKFKGILSERMQENGKMRTILTTNSETYGIKSEKRLSNHGNQDEEYDAIYFTNDGKKFILDNIENIQSFLADSI